MAMGVSGLLEEEEEEEEKERHHGPYKKRRERGRLAKKRVRDHRKGRRDCIAADQGEL